MLCTVFVFGDCSIDICISVFVVLCLFVLFVCFFSDKFHFRLFVQQNLQTYEMIYVCVYVCMYVCTTASLSLKLLTCFQRTVTDILNMSEIAIKSVPHNYAVCYLCVSFWLKTKLLCFKPPSYPI
jgi:hypothetical protein